MIIINLTGGLGNQMFQYALGKYLAVNNNVELKFHFTRSLFNTKRPFELDIFDTKVNFASDNDLKKFGIVKNKILNRILYLLDERFGFQINNKIITERMPYTFNLSVPSLKDNIYLQGFWADERYFNKIKNILQKDFTFSKKLDMRNIKILNIIKRTNSISIHVRRTDFITKTSNNFIGVEYYKNSINKILKSVKCPTFFIFSDDIKWCKKNFETSFPTFFISHNTGKNSYKDMQLMSNCKHNIIANSTFSWWGSWLNNNVNKILIKPEKFL